jgi:hypothetical protein
VAQQLGSVARTPSSSSVAIQRVPDRLQQLLRVEWLAKEQSVRNQPPLFPKHVWWTPRDLEQFRFGSSPLHPFRDIRTGFSSEREINDQQVDGTWMLLGNLAGMVTVASGQYVIPVDPQDSFDYANDTGLVIEQQNGLVLDRIHNPL